MRVVLPIAGILAILIAAVVFGGAPVPFSQDAPTALEAVPTSAAASVTPPAVAYPVAFDPYAGWGVADLQHGGPPVAHSQGHLPSFVEVDPLDRYGVAAPTVPLARPAVAWDWTPVSFAAVRALYEDALPGLALDPVPAGAPAPWWETAPLDAK